MSHFLLVGLGNPGKKYAHNRHNVGFMAIDVIAGKYGAASWSKKFQGLVAEVAIGNRKVLLLKPQTYMNLSGDSVAGAMRFYKISPESICVIHDEVDFEFGAVKLKKSGGTAGHNGLKSIESHIGNDFLRLRFGVGKEGDVSDHVLSDFSKEEMQKVESALEKLSKILFPMIDELHAKGANNLKVDLTDTPQIAVSTKPVRIDSRLRGNDEG
jgi:PTH1 family peptidyl-tRNA hydrolase